ncbi:MAG: UDP-N-acetylmuramate dehydrogenase [Myxococcales bacterium]
MPLAQRTSVRVGGAARLFIKPRAPETLVSALRALVLEGIPWHTLGGGANTVVGDGGVDGAVLRLGPDFASETVEEFGDHVVLTLGAGAPGARLLSLAREQRCVGIAAWGAGIPGTVGGWTAMNAGTPAGAMSDHLEAVEIATPDGLSWLGADKLRLGYRRCELPRGAVLTRARCRVRRGSEAERAHEERAVKADLDKRRATQPLTQPNSGSVFVNPPGNFAGRLIEAAGLKGTKRGGAQISARHGNFIVNTGDATANDVVELIALARRAVRNATGIELSPEVRLVGTFAPPLPAELEGHHELPRLLGSPGAQAVAP